MTDVICDGCGLPIVGFDLDDRHWHHGEGCPRVDDDDTEGLCECDIEYHAGCCPVCNDLRVLVTSYQLGGRE